MEREDPAEPVTTLKVRAREARVLKLIGAYLDLNQQDVLSLFAGDFERKWEQLQAEHARQRASEGR